MNQEDQGLRAQIHRMGAHVNHTFTLNKESRTY